MSLTINGHSRKEVIGKEITIIDKETEQQKTSDLIHGHCIKTVKSRAEKAFAYENKTTSCTVFTVVCTM